MVPPNGPALARSTSTWIHWSSPVVSAKASTRAWVTSSQSLLPSTSPTAAVSSSIDVNTRVLVALPCLDADHADSIESAPVTSEQVRRAPKVLLHDHLDGGLRPRTILEIADRIGHELPSSDEDSLRTWFEDSANSGSLPRYLETFDHTVAVMQSAQDLTRVARGCVEELDADGVVYAEIRYAPEQHLAGDLSMQEVVDAVREGFTEGEQQAAAEGRPIVVRQ